MIVNGVEVTNPVPVAVKEWRPFPKQEEFLRLPDSVFEGLFGGAAGPGKTQALIMYSVVRGFTEHSHYKGLLTRRTFPELEAEVIPRTREWYAPMGATYNEQKKRWTFPSGATEQLGHIEHEKDVHNYDSAEYNLFKPDESTHLTKWQYEYIAYQRVRSSKGELPAIVRAGTNPGNISHEFFRSRFVDPYKPGGKIIIDKKTGLKRIYISATLFDNPVLMKEDPTYEHRLRLLPEAEMRAKLLGDWYTFAGQVFGDFRIEPLNGEPPEAQHVIEPFQIPFWWPKFLAIDWGYAAKTIALWGACSPDGVLYVYRVKSWTRTLVRVWAPEIVDLSQGEELKDIVICHSANQNRGEPLTIQTQVQDAFDAATNGERVVSVRLGERDRIGGKNAIHEYIRWQQVPKVKPQEGFDSRLAERIRVQYGEGKYYEYLSFFTEQPNETNLPKLRIFKSSPEGYKSDELIDCITSCVYQGVNKDGKTPEDVKEFNGDDPYDTLRMLVNAHHAFINDASSEQRERQKLDKVYAQLASSGNQTGFYRSMERIEAAAQEGYGIRARSRVGHRRFSR